MRTKATLFTAVLLAGILRAGAAHAGPVCEPDPGPVARNNGSTCLPTPAECASGNYNGVYDGGQYAGSPWRGAICAGGGGHIALYIAGYFFWEPEFGSDGRPRKIGCAIGIVADQSIGNTAPDNDPNNCVPD